MNQQQFIEIINNLKELANGTGGKVTMEDIKREFAGEELANEQLDMIMDYFNVAEQEEELDEVISQEKLDEIAKEDERFLKEYESDLKKSYEGIKLLDEFNEADYDGSMETVLVTVLKVAAEYKNKGIALADLTQDGNLLAFEMMQDKASFTYEELKAKLVKHYEATVKDTIDLNSDELRVLAKVNKLQETANRLFEENGKKVTLEELATELEWELETVYDLSKYTNHKLEHVEYKNLDI